MDESSERDVSQHSSEEVFALFKFQNKVCRQTELKNSSEKWEIRHLKVSDIAFSELVGGGKRTST